MSPTVLYLPGLPEVNCEWAKDVLLKPDPCVEKDSVKLNRNNNKTVESKNAAVLLPAKKLAFTPK